MPRQKTTLAPEVQLDKTLALAIQHYSLSRGHCFPGTEEECFGHLNFAVLLRSTQDFNKGDIAVMRFNNGGGERWPVSAISSKGRHIVDKYLHFFGYYSGWSHRSSSSNRGKGYRKSVLDSENRVRRDAALVVTPSDQPVRFLDVFQRWTADPTVQREIVATLVAGSIEHR